MKKRLMTLVIFFVFLCSSSACLMPVHRVNWEVPEQAASRGDKIIAVYMKSGEVVNFSAKSPARIVRNAVVGEIVGKPGDAPVLKSIPISEVKLVEVRRVDGGLTFLASAGVWGLIWAGYVFLAH